MRFIYVIVARFMIKNTNNLIININTGVTESIVPKIVFHKKGKIIE